MKEKLPKYIKLAPRKNDKKPYMGRFMYKNTPYNCGSHETIRAAQLAVDLKRAELGLSTEILKKK